MEIKRRILEALHAISSGLAYFGTEEMNGLSAMEITRHVAKEGLIWGTAVDGEILPDRQFKIWGKSCGWQW